MDMVQRDIFALVIGVGGRLVAMKKSPVLLEYDKE